ncbi:hypothetical protein Taro_030196, partial [Colocasia esculenta]|nr:hypothetical protein [Colocasia esculenta]
GYRVVSVDMPCVWNHHEWIHAFEKFLDAINVHHVRSLWFTTLFRSLITLCFVFLKINKHCVTCLQVHLYGTSLGGFLAQLFAQHRPRRVKSLVLSNSFLDTQKFSSAMPWSPMWNLGFRVESFELFWVYSSKLLRLLVQEGSLEGLDVRMKETEGHLGNVFAAVPQSTWSEKNNRLSANPQITIVNWTPSFLLKRYILSGIHDGPHEPFIADSVDFVVGQMYTIIIETLSREDLSSRLTLNATPASVGSLLLSDSFITLMDTNDYCAVPQNLKDQVSERYPGARRAILKSGGDFPFLSRPDEVNLYLQLHLRRVGVEAKPELVQNLLHDGDAGSSSNEKKSGKDFDDPSADNGGAGTHEEGAQQSLGSESHNSDEQLLQSAALFVVGSLLHRTSFILTVLQFYAASLSTTWKPLLKV